ncbi:MAG: hypothetical protein K9W44_05545 [Candidatus Lokiarchaeota archaeon]|nr:hypothetical protein [Candidatus Harpocratesius repetitus]
MYSVYGWKEISNYAFANAREAYEWQLENIPGFKTGFTASYLLDLTEQFYVSTVSGYVGASVTTIAAPLGPVAPLAGAVAGFISYFAMDTVYRFWLREPIQDILGLLGVKEFEKMPQLGNSPDYTYESKNFIAKGWYQLKEAYFEKGPSIRPDFYSGNVIGLDISFWQMITPWIDLSPDGYPYLPPTASAEYKFSMLNLPETLDEYRFEYLMHTLQQKELEFYIKNYLHEPMENHAELVHNLFEQGYTSDTLYFLDDVEDADFIVWAEDYYSRIAFIHNDPYRNGTTLARAYYGLDVPSDLYPSPDTHSYDFIWLSDADYYWVNFTAPQLPANLTEEEQIAFWENYYADLESQGYSQNEIHGMHYSVPDISTISYSKKKISVNPGGAADYLTQFLQKRLGYSEYLQFIKDIRLIDVNNLKSGTQIHEWELLQAAWISLASLFTNIEALRSTIDYLIKNNIAKAKKNDNYVKKYLKEKVVDDHHYYVPPSAIPDPVIIIGAKKNAIIANFIQFGMAKSEVIGSGREVLVFGSMVGQIQNDEEHKIKFFQLGTPISDAVKDIVPTTLSPYSMIIPQFSMDMWDPVNEEYYKTNRPDINNGIERFVMDFLVFENMLNLLGADGGAVNWRYPGIYGVGMHGVEDTNIEYYTEKVRKVWTAFQNGLSMINIFENQDGINTFTKMMKSPEIGGDASKMVLIELEDCRAFFNLRNLVDFQGSSIRDSVSVLAKWVYEQYTLHSSEQDLKDSYLKKKKFYNDIKLMMESSHDSTRNAYIATWNRIEGIIKAFGIKGETITIKISKKKSIEYFVPTLDENGNIQFDSRLDRWYAQIENPVSIFNSNSQLMMLKQCFAYYLKYKNEMRLYYEEYSDESAMNNFDAYLDAIEGFVR